MAVIDVEELRRYLIDYCGTAVFGGFPASILDVAQFESMDARALCEAAERLGVDLSRFRLD